MGQEQSTDIGERSSLSRSLSVSGGKPGERVRLNSDAKRRDVYTWSNDTASATYVGSHEGKDKSLKGGKGKYTWPNGDVYEGDFKADVQHGLGKVIFAQGGSYQGSFWLGKYHGVGNMEWHTGDTYQGAWVHGVREGFGRFTWTDGSVYEGDFVGGKKQGTGSFTFPTGRQYVGSFHDDLFHGPGEMQHVSDDSFSGYKGVWKRNVLQEKLTSSESINCSE
jgi:hypothetical protein